MEKATLKQVLSSPFFLFCIYLGYCVLILAPYLYSGYYYDDMMNSLLPGAVALSGESLSSTIWSRILEWMHNAARFYPLAPMLTMPVYYLNLADERILQVSLVIINIITFISILLKIEGRKTAGIFAIIILSLFQARAYYDPITSFGCLLQFLVLFGSLSIYFAISNLKEKRFHWLLLSLFTYGCSLLIYEEGIIFGLCIGILILSNTKPLKSAIKALIPYIGLTSVWIAILIYLRLTQASIYSGNRPSFTYKTLVSFFYQFSGAFPLTYPLFARSGVFQWKHIPEFFRSPIQYWIFAVCCLVCTWIIKELPNSSNKTSKAASRTPYLLSLILLFASSLMIAISERYQNELVRPGHSYLPVYIAYFGVAIAAAAFFSRALNFKKRAHLITFIIAISFLTTFNRFANSICISHQNHIFKYPRDIFTQLLKLGFLNEQAENSTVYLDEFSWWIGKDFFYMVLKKKIEAYPLTQYFKDQKVTREKITFSNNLPVLMKFRYINPNLSWATLTPIKSASWKPRKENTETIYELTSAVPASPVTLWIYSTSQIQCMTVRFRDDPNHSTLNLRLQKNDLERASEENEAWYKMTIPKELDLQKLEIVPNCNSI